MSISGKEMASEATTYVLAITCDQMKDAEEHLLEYILAWLDTAITDDENTFNVSLGLLRSIHQVYTFNNVEKCLHYLNSLTEKRAFLVLSCTIESRLLDAFVALPKLEYIYVFGEETIKKIEHGEDKILKKEYSKLIHVTSIDKLYSRLSRDLRSSSEEDDDTDFASLVESNSDEKSIQISDGDARIFVFYQLLIEILLHLPKTPEIKQRFISFCMEKTNQNLVQQEDFKRFMQNYTSNDAIRWYTRPCFLHKLLNRTCRLGYIKDMFNLAFFMTDLHAQMKDLHNQYFDWCNDQVDVYRGRLMSSAEFDKLKASIGDLVVTKSFLSTTTERNVALTYSGIGTTESNVVPAILHMTINKQRHETKPFARIRYVSSVPSDDEILLSIGTIFRITEEIFQNGIHEFILFRGDQETKIEEDLKRNFCDQTIGTNDFTNLDDSLDTENCCRQVLEALTPSDDHIQQQIQQTFTSQNTNKNNQEDDSIDTIPIKLRVPTNEKIFERVWSEVEKLQQISNLFILDVGPMFDSDVITSSAATSSHSSKNIIIEGHILPVSEPYCQRSFRVRFILPSRYPYDPPKLFFLDRIWHPNIGLNGIVCISILDTYHGYRPDLSLSDIIGATNQLLTDREDSIHYIVNGLAAGQYIRNRDIFYNEALQWVLLYGHPRT